MKKVKTQKIRIEIIDEESIKRLNALSKKHNRTYRWIIRKIVREFCQNFIDEK